MNLARKRYDRIAPFYDIFESPMEFFSFARWRRELIGSATGRVLEVGIGTGKNLPYYPGGVDLTGIDISPKMLERAKRRASKLGIAVTLAVMDIESQNFPDDTFDYVVSTCVFCSVPDPVRGLAEVARVLKPTGKALFLEHVRSENPFLGRLMDIANPLFNRLIGPNINRRTVSNIKTAGFVILSLENAGSTIVKKIEARRALL